MQLTVADMSRKWSGLEFFSLDQRGGHSRALLKLAAHARYP